MDMTHSRTESTIDHTFTPTDAPVVTDAYRGPIRPTEITVRIVDNMVDMVDMTGPRQLNGRDARAFDNAVFGITAYGIRYPDSTEVAFDDFTGPTADVVYAAIAAALNTDTRITWKATAVEARAALTAATGRGDRPTTSQLTREILAARVAAA